MCNFVFRFMENNVADRSVIENVCHDLLFSDHFTYCLQCKDNCTKTLSTINGDYQSDLLSSHYHYLQFAYFKGKNGQMKFIPNECINNKIFLQLEIC